METSGIDCRIAQLLASCPNPARGNSGNYGIGLNVTSYDRSCSYDGASTNCNAWKYHGASAKKCKILNDDRPPSAREIRACWVVVRSENTYLFGNCHIITNFQASPAIQAASPIDDGLRANGESFGAIKSALKKNGGFQSKFESHYVPVKQQAEPATGKAGNYLVANK